MPPRLTKEERKQRRLERRARIKARREERRNQRRLEKALRKEKWNNAKEKIAALPEMDELEQTVYEEQFEKVWPAVKAVLEFGISLKVTGPKFDQGLTTVIELGDDLATGDTITDEKSEEFLEKLERYWHWAETILNVVKIFTGDEADRVIDKIIEIGDWIFDRDDEEDNQENDNDDD